MNKVSICIPAYNNEKSVKRLLESIEIQSYKDYEVIITDDSDSDSIKELINGKTNIKYYKNEKRLGATANWNQAIKLAGGEFIKIMHHDDWFTDETSLQTFVDMLEKHPEADMAFSGTRQVEEESDAGFDGYERFIAKEDAALIAEDYRNLFLGNTIGAPSAVIVRRKSNVTDIAEQRGEIAYDEQLKWLVDMDYYMQILKRNPHFIYTERPLVSIGTGREQLTEKCRDDRDLNVFEYGYIFEKYGLKEDKRYRKKLLEICLDAKKNYEDIREHGIGKAEYKMAEGEKIISRIKWKLTHLLNDRNCFYGLVFLFLLSLIPILALSSGNYATGDDLGYSRLTHEAWEITHSPLKVLQAAAETVRGYYYGWQGTWFSVFLFSLQPEAFSPAGYVIVPALMLAVWLVTTGLLSYYLLVKKAGFGVCSFGSIYLLFAAAGIQFVPSTKSAIFWYNGAAHYIIPYGIAMLAIYCYIKYMDSEGRALAGSYAGLLVCMTLLGGGNYQAALLAPIVIVMVTIYHWRDEKKRKKIPACILPFAAEAVGLVISIKSPGNKVRGGEEFGFSMGQAVETVLSCFIRGMKQAVFYLVEHPLLILLFVTAAVICRRGLKNSKSGKKYPYPAVFVILSYCVYCAMFAPEIYAGVEVSGGVPNMNYYIFLIMVFGDIIYVEGAWSSPQTKKKVPSAAPVLALAAGLLFLAVFRGDIKQTTTFQCVEYIRSGQAADYKSQMKYQREKLLDDSIKEVVLPQINDVQGPLMHMPLTEDPQAWTNQNAKEYYNKASVIALPREVWEKLQE